MKHIFLQGMNHKTLLMLHGTGGNEQDLLPLAKLIDPEANVLSVRGNVLEYGMPRFFKRLAMGVFDMESLSEETHNLKEYIDQAAQTYQFDRNQVVAVGYSNGANIAASILLHFDRPFERAILLHPMVPIRNLPKTSLDSVDVLITAGRVDQMVTEEDVLELEAMLSRNQAKVTTYWTDLGHQLSREEVEYAKSWYQEKNQNKR
jgi:phospholipase/carboxylesterase